MEDKANAGDTAVEAAENNSAPVAKKGSKTKAAKSQQQQQQQKKKPSRPSTSEMVTTAIKELKDRKGSSLQAIKKYIVTTYKVDAEKVAPFIKRYLKTAVTSGIVVQTKGKGASGSFKLSTEKPKAKPKTKSQRIATAAEPKKAAPASNKRSGYIWLQKTRKPSTIKKTAAAKNAAESPKKQAAQKKSAAKSVSEKKAATKAAAAATAAKAQSKAKKTVKAPAAKTKAPKPKKATTTKTAKTAAKK